MMEVDGVRQMGYQPDKDMMRWCQAAHDKFWSVMKRCTIWSKWGKKTDGLLARHQFNSLFSRTTWVSWHQKG